MNFVPPTVVNLRGESHLIMFRNLTRRASLLGILLFALCASAPAQEIYKDLPFDAEGHTLDIYRANPAGPTVFYVPGGNWYKHDKNLYTRLGVALAGYGINLIVPQYGAEQKYPDNLIDVVEAVKWSQANLATYGISSTQFHLVGHSAGAHLAYQSLTDHRSCLSEADFHSLTLISGLYDINFLVKFGNRWRNWGPLQGWHASPIKTKRFINLPMKVIWAENDYDVVKRQSNHFLHANAKICQPLESYIIPCDDHVTELLNAETNGLLKLVVDTALRTATGNVVTAPVLETMQVAPEAAAPAAEPTPANAAAPAAVEIAKPVPTTPAPAPSVPVSPPPVPAAPK